MEGVPGVAAHGGGGLKRLSGGENSEAAEEVELDFLEKLAMLDRVTAVATGAVKGNVAPLKMLSNLRCLRTLAVMVVDGGLEHANYSTEPATTVRQAHCDHKVVAGMKG
jgi:hypothetical protein